MCACTSDASTSLFEVPGPKRSAGTFPDVGVLMFDMALQVRVTSESIVTQPPICVMLPRISGAEAHACTSGSTPTPVPAVIKDILFRAAERLELPMTLVANKPLRTPPSRFIRMMQVARGFDVADNEITGRIEPGDLVITADIPLASESSHAAAHALNPRGEFYTAGQHRRASRAARLTWTELRGSGVQTGGPPAARQHRSQAIRGSARSVSDARNRSADRGFRRHRAGRGRGRHDVRRRGRATRTARAARRAFRKARREDPHLGRRALQFHQPPYAARSVSFAQSRISAARRWRATRRATSSRWSSAMASAITRRRSGQLFCDESAAQIIEMLKGECDAAGVRWAMPATVERIARVERRGRRSARFEVATSQGTLPHALAGDRDGRPLDSEDRRDAFRLSHRRAVRRADRAAEARAGAARGAARVAGAVRRALRDVVRGDRSCEARARRERPRFAKPR